MKFLLILGLMITAHLDASPRIEALIKKMTLQEKASLTSGLDSFATRPIKRLGIPALRMTDGPNGVRWGKATAFPVGIMLAASFDSDLAMRVGKASAGETLGRGRDILLGPCININRHPFGGRNFESYGEDPWLAGRMAVAWVKGLQGAGVGASTKHYAANNQETLRTTIDVKVEERVLRELYLPAFEAAVKEADTLTIMASYNRLNGHYASANPWLLNEVLKKEWGFKGLVVSDWGATHEGPGAAAAGLDLEMPGPGEFMGEKLVAAVKAGTLKESVIDEQVRRILYVTEALGLFEKQPKEDESKVNTVATQALSRELAEGGAVLLKNVGGALPLEIGGMKTLAVVGPGAVKARVGGGGSSEISPPYSISPLQGLEARLKGKVAIRYSQGVADEDLTPIPASAFSSLQAEYYDNQKFEGKPALVRVEKDLNFDWGQGSPNSKIAKDHFSARFKGAFVAPSSGEFMLGCRGDDGYRLNIDGRPIVENWGDHAAETRSAPIRFEKGKSYAFEVEYYENAGDAVISLGWHETKDYLQDAIEAAKGADAVLVFAGLSNRYESEGSDRVDFNLPNKQDELIQAVAAVNKRCIVVMQSGSPVNVEPWIGKVGAMLQGWFPGLEGGNALAALLLGEANPSGKLPVSFPKRLEDVSSFKNFPGSEKEVRYEEGLFVGYRHFDSRKVEPRFAFGHGLSYTKFEYGGLKISGGLKSASVTFEIKNVGPLAGAEVAQLYVRPPQGPYARPMQELKGFEKVMLKPGESKTVTMPLNERAFQYWNPQLKGWTAEKGSYAIAIGSSSRDIRLQGKLSE